ncbi:Rho GTPase-activating protein 190 [Thelohanellus kitauei]|uniref:Rho GTPase-activating protein 190 n=1 Tax=Thelohanellus kitauei TaxID=669202 RepID=A0A0C2IDH2_THEKT|nr:Rho GTPase-activating protein 190 [Thelohanellus kitauei]
MVKRRFNVMVIGLTGVDQRKESRVGKSLLCNRFIRPAFDDFVIEHDSIYEHTHIYGPVINKDNFLYWGTVSMRTHISDDPVEFSVVEYTNLRASSDLPLNIIKYVDEAIVEKVKSKNKLMYISPKQVRYYKSYRQEYMPYSIKIDGFILVYSCHPYVMMNDVQDEFMVKVISKLESLDKAFIIAATKCDTVGERYGISDHIKERLKKRGIVKADKYKIIETSGLLNVNIATAFRALFSTVNDYDIKYASYPEAQVELENFQTKLLDKFTNSIMNSEELLSDLNFDSMLQNPKYVNLFRVVDLLGFQAAKNFFVQTKQQKIINYKEKILQYCLTKFENCLLETIQDISDIEKISCMNAFLKHLKSKQLFDPLFETTTSDVESLNFLDDFISKLNKENNSNMLKIPVTILRNERFQVLLDKQASHLRSVSTEQKTKQILCDTLEKLINDKKFTINSKLSVVQWLVILKLSKKFSMHVLDPSFKDLYDTYCHKLLLRSKYELHELLYEHSEEISQIVFENKDQVVNDISEIINTDQRFIVLEADYKTLRGNWIFSHYTFYRSNTICLLSPLTVCSEKQASNVLSSLLDQSVNVLELADMDETMILFVITSSTIYASFEAEFLKFAHADECYKYYILYINGNCRKVVPIKIVTSNIAWEEIFSKYSEFKFAFLAIYGDSNTFKFAELVLSDIYQYFKKLKRDQQASKEDVNNELTEGDVIPVTESSVMSNVSIIFCLLPKIIEEYKKFLWESGDSTSIQELMLGRLVELGRNLSVKYNAKFAEPYLEDVINRNKVNALHEFQINDSIKYLEEVAYDKADSLYERYCTTDKIKILMCCMCGDNFPIEIVIGMLLYDKKYEYSNTKTNNLLRDEFRG